MVNWDEMMSARQAEEKYNKRPGTLRKAISIGKFVEGVDCKKFDRDWIISVEALEREYGNKVR